MFRRSAPMATVKRVALAAALLVNVIVVVAAPAGVGAATFTVNSTTGNDATCSAGGTPCKTIQTAINKAADGDTINVQAGTYTEQIVVNKSLTITGAGAATTAILAPDPAAVTGPGGETTIVRVENGKTVTMSGFTIAGPINSCDLNGVIGVFVIGGATLNLSNSTVRDIRPTSPPNNFGCGAAVAIRVGANYLPQAGTATLTNLLITNYEKSGVVVDAPGSSVMLSGSTITGVGSNTAIAQNGVEVKRGATATITGNTISDNICDRVGAVFPNPPNPDDAACGPGQVTATNPQDQARGILVFDTSGTTTLANNTVSNNDVGLTVVSFGAPLVSANITGNAFTANRYAGLELLNGTFTVAGNDITGASNIGVQVGTFGGTANNTTATLTNNRIADADRGVLINDFTPGDAFTATVNGSNNSLAFNGIGVDNTTNTQADFRNNWWGSATGPQAPSNPGGTGVPVVGNVLFSPFLTDGEDISDARGFQPGPRPSPVASVAPTSLTFGNQTVGTTSASQAVTLTNTGTAPLAINVITTSGDFAQTNNCGTSLAASASCTINVTFTPVVAGTRTGNLTIFDNAAGSPRNVALSGTGVAPASPSPSPTMFTVAATAIGGGTINPSGTTGYVAGSQASYTAAANAGQVFLGWTLDGQYAGYASPLTFTVNGNRSLVAQFAARPTFSDVPASDPDYQAITFLAALGIVNPSGVNGSGQFQPNREVARAEMAAFIARVFGWDDEFHASRFPDKCDPQGQGCIDDELWNNVSALADYGVVGGYTDPQTCAAAGFESPCYLPRDPVKRVQVVSIVARAFIKQPDLRPTGFWDRQDANPGQYTNVPNTGTQRSDLTTYRQNAGPIPGQASDTTFPNPEGNAMRRFVIQVLYQAFNAQFGVDRVP